MADQKSEQKTENISFKDTLNLPRTDFPIRADAKTSDPKMLARWEQEDLYNASFTHNEGKEKFILHDGPPYANGHLHLGHAYNKILKDIVCKSQRMMGKHVPVTPGWDCHGLPIERKVTEEKPGLAPEILKKECRAYAEHWINVQRTEFKSLGVLMDWEHPYLTMNAGYEASILRAFGQFVHDGYIEKKNKTVPWCPVDQTVLASAEIEYQDRKDPSIYVLFPLEMAAKKKIAPALADKEISLLVWTTTPWTLPLNRAVLLNPKAEYVILEINGAYVVVGKLLADRLCALLKVEKKTVAEFYSHELVGQKAQHPFVPGLVVPVLLDDSVLLEDGTACVHSAPGAGPEDYEVGVKNHLEIFSPVGVDGRYTVGIQPKELEGLTVTEGQSWVLRTLVANGRLLHKASITHPYPHCWRCRNPLIFRATKQWFCDLSQDNLKQHAIKAVDTINMVPKTSANRLKATLEGRLEWCLSRQRVWGVPIPALQCTACDNSYTSQELVERVAQQVERFGIEWWDTAEIAQLVPADFACSACKNKTFKKESDILDVWFDSGVSHYAVLQKNPALAYPADIYLEGKDQHRGWFQSSLLTSVVLDHKAPMKTIMTHGFTVDEQGRKMSKSLGNVVAPQQMIEKLGTDGLRMWASSIDCQSEAVVSETLTRNVQEVFRKIRNTCRFLLSNLYDFDMTRDGLAVEHLEVIDQHALEKLWIVDQKIHSGYMQYDFTLVFHALGDYCAAELSSFYLDIIKDRLYVEQADGHKRRSAQTACWYILDAMTRWMAPILSFTAEEISDLYQKDKKQSIHLQNFANASDVLNKVMKASGATDVKTFLAQQEKVWDALLNVRSAILKAIEVEREQGRIKHSLEAQVKLYVDGSKLSLVDLFLSQLKNTEGFLKEFLIVSQVHIVPNAENLEASAVDGLWVKVAHADGEKCPRCWNWDVTTNEYKLCNRCQGILKQ